MENRLKEIGFQFVVLIIAVFFAFIFSFSYPGKIFDLQIYDFFLKFKPQPEESSKIALAVINDEALDIVGRWPWPRYEIAKGIEVLKEFGAKRIVFDIEFIDKSRDVLNYDYYDEIKSQQDYDFNFREKKDQLILDPDINMYYSMIEDKKLNVYHACRGIDFTSKPSADIDNDPMQKLSWIVQRNFIPLRPEQMNLTNQLPSDRYMETPSFPFYRVARGLGFTTVHEDSQYFKDIDGVVRRIHLFRTFHDYLVPQLTMPALMDERLIRRDLIKIIPGKKIILKADDHRDIVVPVNKEGAMLINYTKEWKEGPYSPHISYSSLIGYYNVKELKDSIAEDMAKIQSFISNDTVSGDQKEYLQSQYEIMKEQDDQIKARLIELEEQLKKIKDKIILVGVTASSSTDIGKIPIDPLAPMMLVHANTLNTLLTGNFLRETDPQINYLIVFIITLIIFIESSFIKSAPLEILITGFEMVLIFVFSYFALAYFNTVFHYILIFSTALLSFLFLTAFKYIFYDRQKNTLKKAFTQYLSPDVVQQVVNNPSLLKLGGERREITAYFSDIQGFTTISEGLAPEELVRLLNYYLTAMTDIVMSNGGTVDKYEGDAIIAFFGAPIPTHEHAKQACQAVVDMQKALNSLREDWIKQGFPPIHTRMGLNSGPAIIGNMGSQQRMDYTMMGDTVNLAARLEGANKPYGTYSMISETTKKLVEDSFVTRKLDLIKVVGKNKPIEVFELIDNIGKVSPDDMELYDLFHQGLDHYLKQDWQNALRIFRNLKDKYNDPPSVTYIKRCENFMKNPPEADWNGVFSLTSK